MDNFDDFENKSYVKATRVDYKFSDYFSFFLKTSKIYMQINFMLFLEIFHQIFKVFAPDKPKNITGQLALVTGTMKIMI